MTDILLSPRPDLTSRGNQTVGQILQAGLRVLAEKGQGGFTVREIAASCGIKSGNISYYFKSKDELLYAVIESVIAGYDAFEIELLADRTIGARERLVAYVEAQLINLESEMTARIFAELWALTNIDAHVAEQMRRLYESGLERLDQILKEVNPKLSPKRRRAVALYTMSAIEGANLLAGAGRPWNKDLKAVRELTVQTIVEMAQATP